MMQIKGNVIKITIVTLYLIVFLSTLYTSRVFASPSSFQKVDMGEFHSRQLVSLGIEDLSYSNLVQTLNKTENDSVKFHIIYFFGEKGLKDSIPLIIPFLNYKDTNIKIAAADALSMLGDFRGIPALEKICEEKPDDLKCLDAAGVMATIGNLNARKYLNKLSKSQYDEFRTGSLNHMRTLAEKIEATNPEESKIILDDMINVLSEDEDRRVRQHVLSLLGGIKVKDKRHVVERLKELKVKFSNREIKNESLQQMDFVIEQLETKEKQR